MSYGGSAESENSSSLDNKAITHLVEGEVLKTGFQNGSWLIDGGAWGVCVTR